MDQELAGSAELDEISFDVDAVNAATSSAVVRRPEIPRASGPINAGGASDERMSPVFRELAIPTLPPLPREARARLLMQSPSRLYFYWSTGTNPSAPLNKALGDASGYRLALRLLDLTRGTEELHGVDAEGSWWFDVGPDTEYRAEVGFFAPSRPFVRILFSNTIKTPRKGPSSHRSSEARWTISPGKFADVLDASGFVSDAVEVAHTEAPRDFTDRFARQIGVTVDRVAALDLAELRSVLEDLAAGTPVDDLKWKISAELYSLLEEHFAKLSVPATQATLGHESTADIPEEKMTAVGGSLVNIRKPRYRPISSLALR